MVMPRLSATFAPFSLIGPGAGRLARHGMRKGMAFWPLIGPWSNTVAVAENANFAPRHTKGSNHAGRQGVLLRRAAPGVGRRARPVGRRHPRRQDLRELPRRRAAHLGRKARH